ncbi:hypothetical protein BDV23DRAFT_164481 [Aspergillus alliaceus]|uniref:Uncharacterized protein n=1 Tax=Petromyces alliaceus TaxID=209559 RepID=A0A5N7BV87_PETAA|nr:hypothetical protein BDV23DRAFT_164481 [Aspergillus alliaceus]
MNPRYVSNSFVNKSRPILPYLVSDYIVSRESHFYYEGKEADHDQPRALYGKVMNEKARQQLHDNTVRLLRLI